MTMTATPNVDDTTAERVLFMACELSEKTWKLAFTTGPGHKPRERGISARNQTSVLREITQAKKRCGLQETAPVVRCDEAGREGFWLIAFCKPKGSPTPWWNPPPLRSIVASVGPRVMDWMCASY